MTTNPTIDGVSRELLERLAGLVPDYTCAQMDADEEELRKFLKVAPVVERQEPVAVLMIDEIFNGTNGPECGEWDVEWIHKAVEALVLKHPGEQLPLYTAPPQLAELQAEKGPLCFCGLRQTKNPHPEAGVPPGYLEVGTVYDCIPCLNKSRRAWSKRANKAEGEVKELQATIERQAALLDEVLNEVPHGWGASFSDSELAERIRSCLDVTAALNGDGHES